jgi:tripartite-type tricarboxylate transporter receptor subunit TctC
MAIARLSRGMPVALATFLACVPAMAQSEPDFYAGKNLQVIIGVSAGGGYDTWGRIVARHIVRKLPGNPTAVPQNMPGAGSITAGNHIFTAAARDGTVIGILNRDAPLAPLTGSAAARFDATRFSWIGTPTVETNVCFVSNKAAARNIEDIRKREVIMGAVGPGSGSYNYPKALAGLLDLKIKLISGFPGSTDVLLAMERGEVDGMCESLDSVESRKPGAIKAKQLHVLFQGGMEPSPELPGVPFIRDFARNEEERQAIKLLYAGQGLGRPFIAPPDLPAGRLATLRKAFDETMKDAEFLAEAKKLRLDVEPRTGAELEALVKELYSAPKELMRRLSDLVR